MRQPLLLTAARRATLVGALNVAPPTHVTMRICVFNSINKHTSVVAKIQSHDGSVFHEQNCVQKYTTPWHIHKMMQTDPKIYHSTVSQQSNSISFKGTSCLRCTSLCNMHHESVSQTQMCQVSESLDNTLATSVAPLTIWTISGEPTQHSLSLILFIPIYQPSFYPP